VARRRIGRGAQLGRDLPQPHLRDPPPASPPDRPAPAVAGRRRPGRGPARGARGPRLRPQADAGAGGRARGLPVDRGDPPVAGPGRVPRLARRPRPLAGAASAGAPEPGGLAGVLRVARTAGPAPTGSAWLGRMSPFTRALLVAWARGEAGLPRHHARGKPPAGSWTAARIAATLTDLTGSPVTAKMVEKAAATIVVLAGELTDQDRRLAADVRRMVPGARLQLLARDGAADALAAGTTETAPKHPTRVYGAIFPWRPRSRGSAWPLGFQAPRALIPDSPDGGGRQARRPWKRWRSRGFLLSPVASV
jgi:hypothetical protein